MKKFCLDCKKEFEYTPPVGYEDKRKYCDSCSKARKDAWAAKKTAPSAPIEQNQTSEHTVVLNRTEKPHSYEFGKATARHKIYYGNIEDLKEHLEALRIAMLIDEDIETQKF